MLSAEWDDFLDDYAPKDCPVDWCTMAPIMHERGHQGVIWTMFNRSPEWRGNHAMSLQAVLTGDDQDSFKLGLTLIDREGGQLSILLTREQIKQFYDTLGEELDHGIR